MEHDLMHSGLVLGIDLGTTSVKVCVFSTSTQEVICTFSEKSSADIESSIGTLGFEQDPKKIVNTLLCCIGKIPLQVQQRIQGIGVTGQMHGVMLWKTDDCHNKRILNSQVVDTSPLYTWMDKRCTPEFLATLPQPHSHLRLATGHGNATLFWLLHHQEEIISRFDCCGTIMDYVVSRLCTLPKPITTDQLAASMGYFNSKERTWNLSILSENSFPVGLLPEIVAPGATAGQLLIPLGDIPLHVPVSAPLGDVQCVFHSAIQLPNDAVLNLGTSIQIGFICKKDNSTADDPFTSASDTVEYFPYFHGDYLALCAGLNGGNVLQKFVHTLQKWMLDLGFHTSEDELWPKLLSLAVQCDKTTLTVTPTLYGERHSPNLKGNVTDLTADNTSLGEVFKATCQGIVDNLHSLMPVGFLKESGHVNRILASGSVVQNNTIIRERLTEVYRPIHVEFGLEGDSALGAAKIVCLYAT